MSLVERRCDHCGDIFTQRNWRHRLCSRRCAQAVYRERHAERAAGRAVDTPGERRCVVCGSPLLERQASACSTACKHAAARLRAKEQSFGGKRPGGASPTFSGDGQFPGEIVTELEPTPPFVREWSVLSPFLGEQPYVFVEDERGQRFGKEALRLRGG